MERTTTARKTRGRSPGGKRPPKRTAAAVRFGERCVSGGALRRLAERLSKSEFGEMHRNALNVFHRSVARHTRAAGDTNNSFKAVDLHKPFGFSQM